MTVGQAVRFLERAASPWIDVAIRLFLTQLVAMSGAARLEAVVLGLGIGHGPMAAMQAAAHAVRWLAPLLLIGFATRLASLPLLIAWTFGAIGPGQFALALWALLAAWYVVVGPGPISIDALLARGIYDSALPGARPVGRGLAWLGWLGRPVLLLLARLGVAAALVGQGMVAGAWLALPALLAAGAATRLCTVPLLLVAASGMMHDVSNEHLSWLLLLLLILGQGPGVISLDALLGVARARWLPSAARAAPAELPRVVVVGGGFAGIAAAHGLRHAKCDVTLIDRNNHHLFQPLLYQVATASLSPADIATPIRSLFRGQDNVQVRLGQVCGVDAATRTVRLTDGSALPYDMLLLATGARHGYFGNDMWEAHAPGLKTLEDALAIRRRLLLAFERAEAAADDAERAALMTFVVIGGGPTGVEMAGAIAELARFGLAREFRHIDPAAARVLLVQAGNRLLPSFPPLLSQEAQAALTVLGVEVRLDARVEAVDAEGIRLATEQIACRTAFWAAGVTASPVAEWLGAQADRAGRILVAPDLSVPGLPEVFVLGDAAAVTAWKGAAVPGLAPAAKQAGAYAARVVRARLAGRAAVMPFRYRHAGSLATIGRRAAVAEFGRLRLSGATAWWLWGGVHVLFLAGARNRLVVGVQWFWAYLTSSRGTRLITGGT